MLQSRELKQAMTAQRSGHRSTPWSLPVQPALLAVDTVAPFGAVSEEVATAVTHAVLQYITHVSSTRSREIKGPQQNGEATCRSLCDAEG